MRKSSTTQSLTPQQLAALKRAKERRLAELRAALERNSEIREAARNADALELRRKGTQ